MKKRYVVFSKEGNRVYINPSTFTIANFPDGSMIMIDPVYVNLDGVPPHLWEPNFEKNEIHACKSYVPAPEKNHIRKYINQVDWGFFKQVLIITFCVEILHLVIHWFF